MKIVVAGGGTAGWLAAFLIIKTQPIVHQVTLIESSKIGIIGAGEGSTGLLTNIIQNIVRDYGINEQEFVEECDVTAKHGIEFREWTGLGDSYFAPIDGSPSGNNHLDYLFLQGIASLPKDSWHLSTELGILADMNKDTLHLGDGPHAYHFDAHKVGKFFKKQCGNAVTSIDAEILDVDLDGNGSIDTLILDNDTKVSGDFFIDATGFSRVLMNKLGNTWVSYKNNLPVDRAMPFLLDYEEEMIRPMTTAWAQKNGWMWQIPTLTRKGCGYVYSSEFVSDDQAILDIQERLGKEIDPIRVIKFDSGRLENLWVKNCLAIGLAGSFAEPLEATSIHTTIVQLQDFVNSFLSESKIEMLDKNKIKMYNDKTKFMFDLLKDFLVIHYQGGRTDTEFWKYIDSGETLTDFSKSIIEMCQYRCPNNFNFPQVEGIAGWPLWSYILAGTNKITKSLAEKELSMFRVKEYAEKELDMFMSLNIEKNKQLPDNDDSVRSRWR